MEQETVALLLERKFTRKEFIQGSLSFKPRSRETSLRMRRGLRRVVRRSRAYKFDSTDIFWDNKTTFFWKIISLIFLIFCWVLVIYLELFPHESSIILVLLTGIGYIGLLIIDSWLAGNPTSRQRISKLRRKRRLRGKSKN